MPRVVRIDLSKPNENPKNIWDRDQSDPTIKFRTSGGFDGKCFQTFQMTMKEVWVFVSIFP